MLISTSSQCFQHERCKHCLCILYGSIADLSKNLKNGKGVYCFDHVWAGFDRATERGEKTLHPTQKPVALMEWCIDKLKLEPGMTAADPNAGSGSVGVACVRRGLNFVGCELSETYHKIASERISVENDECNSIVRSANSTT